jgi:hypothetical protein
MSCNSDYILQHALNKLYPFKGIFPWAPYTSGINPKYYNLNTKIPILLSIGTEDPNYVIILALYDSLKFHKANVNLIIEQGIGHTLAFADFGKMMVKSIYYLNDTNTISLSSQADIAMMSNESKDIVIKYKNKSTHKIKFKIQSSNPSKVPNPKITSQKGDSIVLNISPAITIYGKFSIVIEATDSLGTSIEQTTFHVNVTKFVDVKNVNNNYLFEIYPNPASDLLNVRNIEAGSILQIFDITGNEILSKVLNSSIEVLNVTNFSKGIYMMKVTGKNSNETKKLVVK